MNKADKNPNYKTIYSYAKSLYDQTNHLCTGELDETYFSLLVFESAKDIISKLKKPCHKQAVLVASILHDIGKTAVNMKLPPKTLKKEWHKHPELGVPLARKFLISAGHSKEFVDEVCYLIKHHDARKDEITNKTLELKILQDADLLADCGMSGFLRPFLYAGRHNRHTIKTIEFLKTEEERLQDDENINLALSKKIAKEKLNFKRKLINLAAKDVNSELLK